MKAKAFAASLTAAFMLAGCATQPDGPTIPVMPGKSKSFAEFRNDDMTCQDFASDRVAGRAKNANDRTILSAIIGAGLGAALGGAVGGGHGAGVGAAAGGVAGTAIGADQPGNTQMSLQRRYNIAYAQCMRAKGNDVPGPGYYERRNWRRPYYGDYPPPPPPGY